MTLHVKNLTLSYSSKSGRKSSRKSGPKSNPKASDNIVIPQVSLTLNEGEITCLIGPNGCGKSTLLKALAGLLSPTEGQVLLDNKTLSNWSPKALARRLTLLPQSPVAPDDISVHQLVSYGRFAHQGLFGRMSQQDIDAVDNALNQTGMQPLKHRIFNTLSGGERQRGWIALALAQQSDILLLDEPTTYLDIGHQLEALDLLSRLNQQQGLTVIMVLHDINQASQYGDRILTMKQGRIIADGTPLEVITPKLMQQVFGIDIELIVREQGQKQYPYGMPLTACSA